MLTVALLVIAERWKQPERVCMEESYKSVVQEYKAVDTEIQMIQLGLCASTRKNLNSHNVE